MHPNDSFRLCSEQDALVFVLVLWVIAAAIYL